MKRVCTKREEDLLANRKIRIKMLMIKIISEQLTRTGTFIGEYRKMVIPMMRKMIRLLSMS